MYAVTCKPLEDHSVGNRTAHWLLALLAPLTLALTMVLAPPAAHAAPTDWYCKTNGYGCLTDFGYKGISVWGYPVNGGNNCTNYAAFRLASNGLANPGNLGNARDWDDTAPAKGLGFRVDGNPAPGSIAQWNAYEKGMSEFGHVAYVDYVEGNQVWLSESDWYGTSGRRVVDKSAVGRFIHFKDLPGGAPVASGTGDGVRHVISGTQAGGVHETYWKTGVIPLATGRLVSFSSPVTAVDFGVSPDDGVHHAISGTQAGEVYETYWKGGNPLTTGRLANFSSPVTALAFSVTSDGVHHVFSGTQAGDVYETYWKGGYALTTGRLASLGSPVTTLDFSVS